MDCTHYLLLAAHERIGDPTSKRIILQDIRCQRTDEDHETHHGMALQTKVEWLEGDRRDYTRMPDEVMKFCDKITGCLLPENHPRGCVDW
jgi:hypothetical protein